MLIQIIHKRVGKPYVLITTKRLTVLHLNKISIETTNQKKNGSCLIIISSLIYDSPRQKQIKFTWLRYRKDLFLTAAEWDHCAFALDNFGMMVRRSVGIRRRRVFVFARQSSLDGLDNFWGRLPSFRLELGRAETGLAAAQKFSSLFRQHLIEIGQQRDPRPVLQLWKLLGPVTRRLRVHQLRQEELFELGTLSDNVRTTGKTRSELRDVALGADADLVASDVVLSEAVHRLDDDVRVQEVGDDHVGGERCVSVLKK